MQDSALKAPLKIKQALLILKNCLRSPQHQVGLSDTDDLELSALSAATDARLLLGAVTGYDRTALIVHDDQELNHECCERLEALLARRLKGEPMAYLLGYKDFYGLRLKVNSKVLIPRPETELIVDLVGKLNPAPLSILDLGTGSGAIALALKLSLKHSKVTALDFSEQALAVAKENAQNLKLEVKFLQSDWFSVFNDPKLYKIPPKFDVIVSNPPYIEDHDPHLKQNGLEFEPITALTSGSDGLNDIRRIADLAPFFLNQGGRIYLEHGYNQAMAVREILSKSGFTQVVTYQDLAGLDRVSAGSLIEQ